MNKKLLSVVLGIVVLFVWYKVISSFFGSNIEEEAFQPRQSFENLDLSELVSNDSIPPLIGNYRDPFLGGMKPTQDKNIVKQHSKPKGQPLKEKEQPTLEWPKISYHGFVKVHGSKRPMVILKINQQLVQITEGERYESALLIQKAYRDSIQLSMNDENKVFYK